MTRRAAALILLASTPAMAESGSVDGLGDLFTLLLLGLAALVEIPLVLAVGWATLRARQRSISALAWTQMLFVGCGLVVIFYLFLLYGIPHAGSSGLASGLALLGLFASPILLLLTMELLSNSTTVEIDPGTA